MGNSAANVNRFISEQASWHKTINFNYINKTGEVKPHTVEVYDTKDDFFFGYDLEAGKTKTFKYASMFDVSMGAPFTPRFEKK